MTRIAEHEAGFKDVPLDPKSSLLHGVDLLTNPRHLRKLENWVLSRFCEVYNRDHTERFEWVKRGEMPDYRVFSRLNSKPVPIEVTEVLDPDRKRDQESKSALKEAQRSGDHQPVEYPAETLTGYTDHLIQCARLGLSAKFYKLYPIGTWLIVYFKLIEFQPPPEDELGFATRVLQAAIDSLNPPERIQQVWVLTNDLRIGPLSVRHAA